MLVLNILESSYIIISEELFLGIPFLPEHLQWVLPRIAWTLITAEKFLIISSLEKFQPQKIVWETNTPPSPLPPPSPSFPTPLKRYVHGRLIKIIQ